MLDHRNVDSIFGCTIEDRFYLFVKKLEINFDIMT